MDSVITNLDSSRYSVKVEEPDIADHGAVVMLAHLDVETTTNTSALPWSSNYSFTYRTISDEQLVAFRSALGSITWDVSSAGLLDNSIPFNLKSFFYLFNYAFNAYFPEKYKRATQTLHKVDRKPLMTLVQPRTV